ncbi:MAG: hypothetical protein AAFO07_14705, partial [Bacteroidota bacterium]
MLKDLKEGLQSFFEMFIEDAIFRSAILAIICIVLGIIGWIFWWSFITSLSFFLGSIIFFYHMHTCELNKEIVSNKKYNNISARSQSLLKEENNIEINKR